MKKINDKSRAPLPNPLPKHDDVQGMYDFLSEPLMYVRETTAAFNERKQLLNSIDAKIDAKTIQKPTLMPPQMNTLLKNNGYIK
jgi:hypothetical protein